MHEAHKKFGIGQSWATCGPVGGLKGQIWPKFCLAHG